MSENLHRSVAFFLPVRSGSVRVLNKNTRKFSCFSGGLLENKLKQLSSLNVVDEVILSTNDQECVRIAKSIVPNFPKLRIVQRPESLCRSTTNLIDLIKYVPTITDADHIFWGHVTTPLVDANIYTQALNSYFDALNRNKDSLIGVTPFRNFLLNTDGKMVNNSTQLEWPRTQDLEPLYEINHTAFIAPRALYECGRRSGSAPELFEIDKVHAYDVDWEDDFTVAETLYNVFIKGGLQ